MRKLMLMLGLASFYLLTIHLLAEHKDWISFPSVWIGLTMGLGWAIYVDKIVFPKSDKADKNEIASLKSYVHELCDEDCPKEYKGVVKQVVFGSEA